ncbi:MAG TPA: DUF3168 domain-containing protein [Mycobacteriales bacterium]
MAEIPEAEPHVAALKQMLVDAGLQVGVGEAPDGVAAPYVVLYPDPGLTSGTLGSLNTILTLSVQVTAVGVGAEQALQQADRARTALLGAGMTVPGRVVHPVRAGDAQPVRRDDGVQPPLWVAIAGYTVVSDPA